ncbi:hypothetical protein SSX86_011599 [Deinandra increscens subsp. villosa]|uniref:Inositol polyphosphate-related phosphatase domain-containing protein n=1 Tax=Deinandra increscens subsp. villosa TaxID=3103831 RepID=A0AAP0DB61_9ASTR
MSSFMNHPHPHSPRPRTQAAASEPLWPRIVIRKWFNRNSRNSEYNADPEDDYATDGEEETDDWSKDSRSKDNKQGDDSQTDPNGAFCRSRRRKSETFRAQYIDAKELKVSVNTWNVGGKLPPEDLDIKDWIDVDNPADIYVIGFQEVIPLTAGNIFGSEDHRPVPIWENIIRGTLNKIQPEKTKFKSYSNPPSPSKFKPSDDIPDIEDEVVLETDSEGEEEIHPFNEESSFDDLMDGPTPAGQNGHLSTLLSMEDIGDSEKRYSSQKTLDKVNSFSIQDYEGTSKENLQDLVASNTKKLTRILSGTERIGLSWPEPPLDLLAQCVSPNPLKTVKSFKASKSFRTYASFKSYMNVDNRIIPEEVLIADLDLDSIMYRKRRPPYVRVVSKQMVGVFITIWVRRHLRKHIHNVHVSAVGVGVMGYIGNKGSISVSMSIYQTVFCFVCSHLTSGERDADAIKRNADVHEIHKRTRFNSISNSTLPKRIENHEFSSMSSFMNHPHPHSPRPRTQAAASEPLWPRIVIRKWFNRNSRNSEYNADPEDDYATDGEEETDDWSKDSRSKDNKQGDDSQTDPNGAFCRSRRRKSETFRAQYIDAKELKVSVNTWNVGGKLPPEDLDIKDWIDVDNPADIYVIGFQEVIPLTAGNIFGSEDHRPVPIWENIIRGTLNKIQPEKTKFKSYSNPPSPSKFKPSDDIPDIEDEVVLETDSEGEEEIHPFNEESSFDDLMDGPTPAGQNGHLSTLLSMEDIGDSEKRYSSQKTLDKVNSFSIQDYAGTSKENLQDLVASNTKKLTRILSGTERIGLSWPEPPLDLLAQCVSPNPLKTVKSFKASKSFRTYASFKSYMNVDNRIIPEEVLIADLDLDSIMYRKRRPPYVRVVSKQMVGVFITIWVRRHLRKHIHNVHVSAVGVGVMGYIGNKGSISVSMSIYQTVFCFVCSHLTSGERDADAIKRNADVHEIHKRTRFNSISNSTLPKRIENHERIIWLGDLNYRLNLSYEKTRDLISKNELSKLLEFDQLVRELRKGRAFSGWSEGVIDFPPTYKYERNSGKYCGEDPKVGRRTPAWCDRILSFGKGIRQLRYTRAELRFSDHRPVSASYMIEVEVFSPRKLQKALTVTDAEIENDDEMGLVDAGISHLILTTEVGLLHISSFK